MATLYNSFYGGRRGASFVIVKSFLDILSMTTAFSRGNEYTEVAFDEYVIINNPLKNHPDNGKIFRRGYDINSDRTITATVVAKQVGKKLQYYTEEPLTYTHENISNFKEGGYNFYDTEIAASGAILIGSIIGPAGKSPLLQIGDYDNISDSLEEEGFESRYSQGELSLENNGLVPGFKMGQNGPEYQDTIEYKAFSIRNADYSDDTIAYIGFKIPYTVTEWSAEAIDQYNNSGNIKNVLQVLEETNTGHPFYKKYNLKIPKGINGQSFRNLRVVSEKKRPANLIDVRTGSAYVPSTQDFSQTDGKAIIVYQAISYNQKRTGVVTNYYLGDYNQIENVIMEDNGSLTINYTSNASSTFQKKIKWIDSIQLNSSTKKLDIHFNTGGTTSITIPFVDNIKYDDSTGKFFYHIAGEDENKVTQVNGNPLRYVQRVVKGAGEENKGKLVFYYNDNGHTAIDIKDVQKLGYITKSEYGLYINNTINDTVTQADLGKLYVKYTNGTVDFLTDSPLINIQRFEFINGNLIIQKAGSSAQIFSIDPPTEIFYDIQTALLKYHTYKHNNITVGKMPLLTGLNVGEDLNLYAKFNTNVSDSETYETIKTITGDDGTGHDGRHPVSEGWFKIGDVRHVVHPLIYKNITLEELNRAAVTMPGGGMELTQNSSYEDVITVLNYRYPQGITQIPGQTITIGNAGQQKDFYAYNYHGNPPSWYFLGRIEKNDILISENQNISSNDQTLFKIARDICNVDFSLGTGMQGNVNWTNKLSHLQKGNDYINQVSISPTINSYRIEAYVDKGNGVSQQVDVEYNPVTKILKIEDIMGDLSISIIRGS